MTGVAAQPALDLPHGQPFGRVIDPVAPVVLHFLASEVVSFPTSMISVPLRSRRWRGVRRLAPPGPVPLDAKHIMNVADASLGAAYHAGG